jgi:hypothetical protein
MKQSIVWLASYPKSGNTWVRLFVANYILNQSEPIPINELRRFGSGDAQWNLYQAVSGGRVDLRNPRATVQLRERVLQGIVSNNADINLVKTHNRRTQAWGTELFPKQYTRSAVYVMRNPLDMVLSYARHYGLDHATAVEHVSNRNTGLVPDGKTVAQFTGSWSDHVESWTNKSSYPVLVLRYEDLLASPVDSFEKVVTHLNMTVDQQRLERAIKHSGFEQVQQQEQAGGFNEAGKAAFFGKGAAGQWRDELAPELVQKMRQAHKHVMKRYGYWRD